MTAFILMAILGALLALVLAYASKRFEVKTDPRVEEAIAALPGINCGGCGYPGCSGYAEAVVLNNVDPTLCAPGGIKTGMRLAEIVGVVAGQMVRQVSLCHCQKTNVKKIADYTGIQTCRGASLFGLGGGWLDCRYGCMGYGDCEKVCPFGAISMGADERPVVNEDLCTGCKKCVVACPRNLMTVSPINKFIHVRCHNRDKGPMANKICTRACIACKKCEKICPTAAIKVPNFLAEIDYSKCIDCGECVKVCPHQVIADMRIARGLLKSTEIITANS